MMKRYPNKQIGKGQFLNRLGQIVTERNGKKLAAFVRTVDAKDKSEGRKTDVSDSDDGGGH